MKGFPCLPQDEGSQSKSSDRVSQRFIPDGVHQESRKSNPSHVTTEGRFRNIRLQSCTGRYDCQLLFPVRQPRHHNGSGQQDSDSYQTTPRLAVSEKIQNRSQHHEACQREKQASCDSGCPRLTQCEAKTPEHDGCRKQLDQTVSSESEESRTIRTPSRPERNNSLYGHPADGENLKLKNAPRDIRQLR